MGSSWSKCFHTSAHSSGQVLTFEGQMVNALPSEHLPRRVSSATIDNLKSLSQRAHECIQ